MLHIDVINSHWRGRVSPDGMLLIKGAPEMGVRPVVVAWEGPVPHDVGRSNYNEAIAWVQQQIDQPSAAK